MPKLDQGTNGEYVNVAANTALVQDVLLACYSVEVVKDWMLDPSEDFVAKHGADFENEIKAYLKSEFPDEADSPELN